MLLDRVDELPLRRHEIRGNPAGLLARLVDRIDALKAAGVTAERFRRWADEREAGGGGRARLGARASASSPRSTSCTTRCCARPARSDEIDAVLELTRLLGERPALAAPISRSASRI